MHLLSHLVLLGSIASTALSVATCPTPTTCKGVSGLVATALKTYATAQTFCSSKYPVARRTCTSTALALTLTSAVATNTVTAVATATVTVTSPSTITQTNTNTPTATVTAVVTETDTETDTATATVTVTVTPAQKRSAEITARAVDPKASQLSSLKAQASAFVGAVCTCIEKPASTTVTTTPTVTSSVTGTVTVSSTATATATVTPLVTVTAFVDGPAVTVTATSTTTTTTSTTTTVTTTATVTAAPNPPAQTNPRCNPNDSSGCSATCGCDPIFLGPDNGKAFCFDGGAGAACSSTANCAANEFCDTDISLCLSYSGCTSTFVPSAKRDIGSGLFASGRAGRMKLKPRELLQKA